MTREPDVEQLGKVAVLYGGTSSEREVSLDSGRAVIDALNRLKVDVVPIDAGASVIEDLLKAKPDRVFIALHGEGGEDGRIQALLEFMGLPYTGSGVAASALCMDKLRTKQLWLGVGLPTPEYRILHAASDWKKIIEALDGDVIVKPSHEGSSIGITRCSTPEALKDAYNQASQLDSSVIAEHYIKGAEYTVAVLGNRALPPIRLETDHIFYDYDAKYLSDNTRYLCPCGLNSARVEALQKLALDAFDAVGAAGWGRVDVMEDAAGRFYLLEVNTVPGMTSHSLVPMAAKAAGVDFDNLVKTIIRQTVV